MFKNADWIWTREKQVKPAHFTLFRKKFNYNHKIKRAEIICCADSKYRLWVNGCHLGTGPVRGNAQNPYFDAYDIAEFLKEGENTIAFLVEHYTSGSIVFSPVAGGLLCELFVNNKSIVFTDKTWKCLTTKAYRGINSSSAFLHFEVFDARRFPYGWLSVGFKDDKWLNANELKKTKLAPPGRLRLRPIPHLTQKKYNPINIISLGTTEADKKEINNLGNLAVSLKEMKRKRLFKVKTNPRVANISKYPENGIKIFPAENERSIFLEIDFGREILGTPVISVEGNSGLIIDIGYSETLEDNKVNPYRQHIFYADRIIAKSGQTTHRINQPRGFRYMNIRLANVKKDITIHELYAIEEIYPALNRGHFLCSDSTLNDIYSMCFRTMNLCLEDSYTDCPWRERQQWLGDILVESLTTLYGLGGIDITRKAIREFAKAESNKEGWMPSVFPGGSNLNLPTFGMLFPVIVWNYYMYTGEADVLDGAYDAMKRMDAYLQGIADKNGFILTERELSKSGGNNNVWHFVDWTKLDARNGDGIIQGLYLYFLKTCSCVATKLNRAKDAANFDKKAEKLKKNILNFFWSEENGCFLKYRLDGTTVPASTPPLIIGQHENFVFPLLGIGTAENRSKALQAIKGHGGKYLPDIGGIQNYFSGVSNDQEGSVADQRIIRIGSPYFSYFALKSLFAAGKNAEAIDYIRAGWGYMLDNGSTTCWEMWGGETSRCHGYSTAPLYFFIVHVLGVVPRKPGFSTVKIAPELIDLAWAKGTVPTKHGKIHIRWEREKSNKFNIIIDLPGKMKADFYVPRGYLSSRRLNIDGKKSKMIKIVSLEPGRHEVSLIP